MSRHNFVKKLLYMNVQKEIREQRESKGLSREKLAQLCGTTSQTIYRAEKSGKITLSAIYEPNKDHNRLKMGDIMHKKRPR